MRRRVRKGSKKCNNQFYLLFRTKKFQTVLSSFRNGTLAQPAGVVLADLELNLNNEYFVFVNGDPLPLSG